MAYSNKEDQLAASRKHYANNKQYYADRNAARKDRIREFIRAAKDVPCMDCGVKYSYYVMDFDHREDKAFNISNMMARMMSIDTIQKEMNKCDVICSNCHRERTHKRRLSDMV